MPITINGSGTLTGITAGGLPDAIITTDEVANASITPAKLSQKLTSGTAVASTSGTSIDFTSIPSWVKRITVMFSGVSTNGASNWQVQIGSGSFTSSGYVGSSSLFDTVVSSTAFTTGFGIRANAATISVNGALSLNLVSGNTWIASGAFSGSTSATSTLVSGGTLTLGGALDRVRITTVNGTDTFDAGSINILYEG